MSDDNKSADEVMEKFKPLEMKPMTNVQQLQQQLAEKDKRIAELEPLAKCAIELRTWFRVNEFWVDENSD